MSGSAMSSSGMGSSRPFLQMLNPIGRHYRGYHHPEDLVEEDEDEYEEEDLQAGASGSNRGNKQTAQRTERHSMQPRSSSRAASSSVVDPYKDGADSEDDDEEVPQSLFIEARRAGRRTPTQANLNLGTKTPPSHARSPPSRQPPFSIPRPSEIDGDLPMPVSSSAPASSQGQRTPAYMGGKQGLDAYERALWNWVNVANLDAYLQEVYSYYAGKGIYCIALSQGLNLLTVGFVISFSMFLLGCIDYSRFSHDVKHLSDVVIDRCVSRFSGFTLLLFLSFAAFYVWSVIAFVLDMIRLVDMYNFYTHLLGVPDADIQTISWPEIVTRISQIRQANPLTAFSSSSADPMSNTATAPLNAHDIANRIMRQENYLIALFNKDVLDLRLPLPPFVEKLVGKTEDGRGKTLTRALEWNLRFCLLTGFLFDKDGKVKKMFIKEKHKRVLSEQLRRRFIIMGFLNAIFAPFIVLYLIMYSFFRYFEETHNNPSKIGSRRYTLYAKWKFREFNELPHLFKRRLDMSYPIASEYLDQFPKEKVALIMRFVAFVAGSFAAVLVLASVIDPDLVLHFEITPHRTVLFYLGVFGSVLAVARGMIPEDNKVFDPEMTLREVIKYTHYMPTEWKGNLHSQEVNKEFGQLFTMKIMIFAEELLSVILTPIVLWFSLSDCSPAIIDFFREFTVHVDGLGHVCSFAVFDFKRHGNVKFGAPAEGIEERLMSKEGKMEKSFLNFKAANPEWTPTDPSGSMYLSRLNTEYQRDPVTHQPAWRTRALGRYAGIAAGGKNPRDGGQQGNNIHNNGNLAQSGLPEQEIAERALSYERALQKSVARRRIPGGAGAGVGVGGRGPSSGGGGGGGGGATVTGMDKGKSTATSNPTTSANSAGDATADASSTSRTATPRMGMSASVPESPESNREEGAGGDDTELDDSYVDGLGILKRAQGGGGMAFSPRASGAESDDEMLDDGVMGLLTQIYNQRKRVAG
ncbi:hypothetical protein BOTBODRAFT_29217 [Botryobasidium botryosum FD-172 SS1]|uniref:Autophagy-related protein 9 n=1 Tax=Botryobasidium botryosum (strain FD-172 SS1) TaxID=930990 RepID=A0A067N2D4_BOTB1|nr:hypothetical protein BOTBODRAFT_29217 [Botryobasidium botryosum FD-172 SS1]